ncbi:MAG: 50S ribosomal protein L35 [bacterium]|nr:50S ribosomal protein L35 [bacterium]
MAIMSAGKTNKSVSKRFKLTRKGKLMRKHSAVNHFNARRSKKNMRQKRKSFAYATVNDRAVKQYLPFN